MSSGEAGSSWPRESDTTDAAVSTVGGPVGEDRPPGIAKNCSGSIESEIAASSGEAGSSWPGERDTTSADVTAVAKSVVEARPPGIAKHSATTVAAAVAKYGDLGEARPLEAAKCRAATESELAESFGELPARLLGLAKYRLRRSRQLTLLQS